MVEPKTWWHLPIQIALVIVFAKPDVVNVERMPYMRRIIEDAWPFKLRIVKMEEVKTTI